MRTYNLELGGRLASFWIKVDAPCGDDDCWNWLPKTRDGYGRFHNGERLVLAHRHAYELEVGPIPQGLHIDHLCGNRRCVNPRHLEPVTQAENNRRAAAQRVITHCKRGHEFTPENTGRQANGHRRCLQCTRVKSREWMRRYRAKKRDQQ